MVVARVRGVLKSDRQHERSHQRKSSPVSVEGDMRDRESIGSTEGVQQVVGQIGGSILGSLSTASIARNIWNMQDVTHIGV